MTSLVLKPIRAILLSGRGLEPNAIVVGDVVPEFAEDD